MAAVGMEGALGYGLALGQTVAAAAWIPERVVAVVVQMVVQMEVSG